MCGPKGFIELVRATAAGLGWDADRLLHEEFVSMAADPFAMFDGAAGGGASGAATLGVVLDGQHHQVPWRREHSMTEALISAGLDAPRSCMAGRCATCSCVVVNGEVETRAETATADQLRDGVVLGCQTRPLSDAVEVSFAGHTASG